MSARVKRRARTTALVGAVLGALVIVSAAAADKEKIQLNPADQAAARAVLVTHADLGNAAGWKGKTTKPDLDQSMPCSDFKPKQSDLVLTGAADNTWSNNGIEIDSEAQVLRTPAMVDLDWKRTVVDPRVLPCLRHGLADQIPKGQGALVSFKRMSFPTVGTHAAAFRGLVDVKASGGTVRMVFDFVLTYGGRTEISLTVVAPAATATVLRPLELKLAQSMVARATA